MPRQIVVTIRMDSPDFEATGIDEQHILTTLKVLLEGSYLNDLYPKVAIRPAQDSSTLDLNPTDSFVAEWYKLNTTTERAIVEDYNEDVFRDFSLWNGLSYVRWQGERRYPKHLFAVWLHTVYLGVDNVDDIF